MTGFERPRGVRWLVSGRPNNFQSSVWTSRIKRIHVPRPRKPHPDQLVDDLMTVRFLRWNEPRDFEELFALLRHPAIAGDSHRPAPVAELKGLLTAVVDWIEAQEQEDPPEWERSIAFGARLLLRLEPQYADDNVTAIQSAIATKWKKWNANSATYESLTPDGFRKHLQTGLYEDFADKFRQYVADRVDTQILEEYERSIPQRGRVAPSQQETDHTSSEHRQSRMCADLASFGITYVYPHREEGTASGHNSVGELQDTFQAHGKGTVRLIGVTLRVFFYPTGVFFGAIESMLDQAQQANCEVSIQALTSDPHSPESLSRPRIEEPDREDGDTSQLQSDIDTTARTFRKLYHDYGGCVELRHYLEAPYYTGVLFPHVAYFSPNILSPAVPAMLPMIVFAADSHGYRVLQRSFEHLWDGASQVVPARRRAQPATDVIRGKLRRTELIIRQAVSAASSDGEVVIRMWQGLGPLSLSDNEYPDDLEYSDLLRRERDGIVAALDAGCDVRVIVTRRSYSPVKSDADARVVQRLLGRCRNLIAVCEKQSRRETAWPRLAIVYSNDPHPPEYCFGTSTGGVLIRGTHADGQLSYEHSLVLREPDVIAAFIERFDVRFGELGGAPGEDGQLETGECARATLSKLRELEVALAVLAA